MAVATHGAEVHSEYNSLFQESRNGKDAGKELKLSRQFLEGLFHYCEVCEYQQCIVCGYICVYIYVHVYIYMYACTCILIM